MALDIAFVLDAVVVQRGGIRVLDDVSDHIHKAATTAIIGPSGAGNQPCCAS